MSLPLVPILSQMNFLMPRMIHRICPSPRPCVTFRSKLVFYSEELLAPHRTPKLQDHPLLAVHDCLCNIFKATLHIWKSLHFLRYVCQESCPKTVPESCPHPPLSSSALQPCLKISLILTLAFHTQTSRDLCSWLAVTGHI